MRWFHQSFQLYLYIVLPLSTVPYDTVEYTAHSAQHTAHSAQHTTATAHSSAAHSTSQYSALHGSWTSHLC
jgi:hypothetical protein